MRKEWRRILIGGGGVMATLGLLTAARWSLLTRNGRRLVAQADALPRAYAVGAGSPLRMVALGDSTAEGVGAGSLEATLPCQVARALRARVTVENLAVSGARLGDVVRKQTLRVPYGTEAALVSVSANDATHGTDPAAFGKDLERLLGELANVRRVILSTTPNFQTTPALPWLLNRRFGWRASMLTRIVREVAARHPNVRLADLYREGTLTPEQFASDGFHPNAAGYKVWAALFAEAFRRP